MKRIYFLALPFLMTACAGNPTAESAVKNANEKFYKEQSPIRTTIKTFDNGGSILTYNWAGSPGISIVNSADEVLKLDIFKVFKDNCGFDSSDLKEVRIVEHKQPLFYEVWVFNDKQSTRTDGTSAMSVILKALPNHGGMDILFKGSCHA